MGGGREEGDMERRKLTQRNGMGRELASGFQGLSLALKPAVLKLALPLLSLRCNNAGNSPKLSPLV